jgi:hypothetical protein
MVCFFNFYFKKWKLLQKILFAFGSYLIFISFCLPILAKKSGRVPLPVFKSTNLKPAAAYIYILNRHYVKVKLKEHLNQVQSQFKLKHPTKVIYYLDAGFPFYDKFPLLPHISHGDGKKVDISFIYDNKGKDQYRGNPSMTGYGHFEEPRNGEWNTTKQCLIKNKYYGMTKYMPKKWNKRQYILNEQASIDLLKTFSTSKKIDKILLEPHLKGRWKLNSFSNVRFQGCQAVRHDDHFHIQVK